MFLVFKWSGFRYPLYSHIFSALSKNVSMFKFNVEYKQLCLNSILRLYNFVPASPYQVSYQLRNGQRHGLWHRRGRHLHCHRDCCSLLTNCGCRQIHAHHGRLILLLLAVLAALGWTVAGGSFDGHAELRVLVEKEVVGGAQVRNLEIQNQQLIQTN